MTLSREEIAVRLACADVQGSSLPPDKDRAVWAAQVVATTDAIGAALTHTPAPVAPPAGKYEPRVGDVVRWGTIPHVYVVTRVSPELGGMYCEDRTWREWFGGEAPHYCEFVRKATPSELAAAGLAVPPPAPTPAPEVCCASPLCPHSSPGGGTSQVGGAAERDAGIVTPASPTPAPEAKRPTHVRVTKIADTGFDVAVGSVYEVVRWYDDGGGAVSPQVMADNGELVELAYVDHSDADYCPSWEPAPCPPPVAGRGEKDEAVRGLVAFAARVSDTLRLDGTKRNADLVTEAGRLVALAREAGLCEGGSK